MAVEVVEHLPHSRFPMKPQSVRLRYPEQVRTWTVSLDGAIDPRSVEKTLSFEQAVLFNELSREAREWIWDNDHDLQSLPVRDQSVDDPIDQNPSAASIAMPSYLRQKCRDFAERGIEYIARRDGYELVSTTSKLQGREKDPPVRLYGFGPRRVASMRNETLKVFTRHLLFYAMTGGHVVPAEIFMSVSVMHGIPTLKTGLEVQPGLVAFWRDFLPLIPPEVTAWWRSKETWATFGRFIQPGWGPDGRTEDHSSKPHGTHNGLGNTGLFHAVHR
jgi:hypothetical protein